MTDRSVYRFEVPNDQQPHPFRLARDPLAVAAVGDVVEFWTEDIPYAPLIDMTLQVFGTGRSIPAIGRWVGTCARTPAGEVWHLYDLGPGGGHAG